MSDMRSATSIAATIKNSSWDEFQSLYAQFSCDPRKAIQTAIAARMRSHQKQQQLLAEHNHRKRYEKALNESGFKYVAGIDEVGRGPLAGPVYAAAVILDPEIDIFGIKDSKRLSAQERERLSSEIIEKSIACSIGMATHEEIDNLNILNATKLAMKRAIDGLPQRPDYLLIDALKLEIDIPQLAIIKGDDLSISIGAASIIAKVARDNLMRQLSKTYPEYHLEQNKGYGSKDHIDALKKCGPCPIHRKSFIKNLI